MAANLVRAGFELSVYTRTREKAERFADEHGATAAATPREAAEGASAVITMVPDAPEVEEVLLGEQGAVHGLAGGALAIDMSTIAPTAARAIGERLADDRVAFLEAPVSAPGPRPRTARSRSWSAASRPTSSAPGRCSRRWASGSCTWGRGATPSWRSCSRTRWVRSTRWRSPSRCWPAESAGLNRTPSWRWRPAARATRRCSASRAARMFERDFKPLFKLEHMLKDVRHCLDEARALGVELRLGSLVEPLYTRAAEAGHAEEDFAAVSGHWSNRGKFPLKPGRYVRQWAAPSPPDVVANASTRRFGGFSSMPVAFKEWAVTVRALAEGEQLLTLRKGGIPRGEQALRDRARPLLPLPHVRSPAQRPDPPVARARAGRARSRRASGPTTSRPRRRCSRTAASRSPSGCGSAPGPRSPPAT